MEKEIKKNDVRNVLNYETIKLSKEQEFVLDKMEKTLDNIFVTGKAGSGKSELLKHFVKTTKKKVVVLAPTGFAAIDVMGQTIHSLFGLRPLDVQRIEEIKHMKIEPRLKALLNGIDVLLIDEISMVGPDLMETVNVLCKKARNSDLSFGGIQLICFGDLYQLPPIVKDFDYLNDTYGGIFFFNAHAFENTNLIDDNSLKIYELEHIFRQRDSNFKNLLNQVRVGNVSSELLDVLNSRVTDDELGEDVITLATRNDIVASINKKKLDEINSEEYVFKADVKGNISESYFHTDAELYLKVGSRVMMVNNDSKKRWVNGSKGTITELTASKIKVRIANSEYSVDRYTWDNYKHDFIDNELKLVSVGSFTQFPIKLAWAVTIHKSQGKTYNSVLIDLGSRGAFTDGQTYVALSRCTSLETLYLRQPIKSSDIRVNSEVVNFMKNAEVIKLDSTC